MSLPKPWIRKFDLNKGSAVAIDLRSDGCLIINPRIKEGGKIEEEITLEATKAIPREIVKYSMIGIEKIIVVSDKPIDKSIKHDIDFFIKRLPNTEIIEDTPQRIEIRNFDIEKIPTNQTIKRILYLARDMFELLGQDNSKELKQKFEELRRFYYIFVTHVRRYLRTGIYISEDVEFTPLEALDYRMFCQKIEKIAEILLNLQLNDKIRDFFRKIEAYFNEILDGFLSKNSDKVYDLWFKRGKLILDAKEAIKTLDHESIDKIKDLVMIAHYCKDMSALI